MGSLRCSIQFFGDHNDIFLISVKVTLSLSDSHEIFTTDLLWIEVCQNAVLSKSISTKNFKIDKSRILRDLELLLNFEICLRFI